MSSISQTHGSEHAERVALFALEALPAAENAAMEAHLAGCAACRRELDGLRPVVAAFAAWPTDILRPTAAVWNRLAETLAQETGRPPPAVPERAPKEPAWKQAGPGLEYQLLATDAPSGRVSMLVRLAPGAEYPAHVHAGVEELHLLDGELWIDQHKVHPGDYNRAEPGTSDKRVWSETGCTCVLVTSHRDLLG